MKTLICIKLILCVMVYYVNGCAHQTLIQSKTYQCTQSYDKFTSSELGIAGAAYQIGTIAYWFKPSNSMTTLRNYTLSRLASYKQARDRFSVQYTTEYLFVGKQTYITLSHTDPAEGFSTAMPIVLNSNRWYYFYLSIDYSTNTYLFNFFDPSFYSTGSTEDGELILSNASFSGQSETERTLDNDILFIGGDPNNAIACGTFASFHFFAGVDVSFGYYGHLRYGITPTIIDILPLTESFGQVGYSAIKGPLQMTLGDSSIVDSQDLEWSSVAQQGLNLSGSPGKYSQFAGNFSLVDDLGDINFGLSFLLYPLNEGEFPKDFLSKGNFSVSYDSTGKFSITFANVSQAFQTRIPFGAWTYLTLFCTSKYRENIFCFLNANYSEIDSIAFPSNLTFTDKSLSPILIPPPTSTTPAIGLFKSLIISRDRAPIYIKGCHSPCLLSIDLGCYMLDNNSARDTSCSNGTMKDSQLNFCFPCDITCATCTNSTTAESYSCSACNTPYTLNGDSCSCPSENAYLAPNDICMTCDKTCKTCDGSTSTDCLSCQDGLFFDASTSSCYDTCPSGKFNNTATQTCDLCSTNCSQCTSISVCTMCSLGSLLFNGNCVQECPSLYYALNGVCYLCPAEGCPCPVSYAHDSNGVCQKCGSNCYQCKDETTCLKCIDGMILNNGECIQSYEFQSSVASDYNLVLSEAVAVSPGYYATQQRLYAALSQDVTVSWIIYAVKIYPEAKEFNCSSIIQNAASEQNNSNLKNLIVRYGSILVGRAHHMEQPFNIDFNVTGLRTKTEYRATFCVVTSDGENENLTIGFRTKDNGFKIRSVEIALSGPLQKGLLPDFLCKLSSSLGLTSDQVLTETGETCPNNSSRRVLQSAAADVSTSIKLFLYGRTDTETDSSTQSALQKLSDSSFLSSFSYQAYKIIRVKPGQETQSTQPEILGGLMVASINSSSLLIYNLTVSGTDGYGYFLLQEAQQASQFSYSSEIMQLYHQNGPNGTLIRREYTNSEEIVFQVDNLDSSTHYVLTYFLTNYDVSNYALRTPLRHFSVMIKPINTKPEKSLGAFLLVEFLAIICGVVLWFALFYTSKKKQRVLNTKSGGSLNEKNRQLKSLPTENVATEADLLRGQTLPTQMYTQQNDNISNKKPEMKLEFSLPGGKGRTHIPSMSTDTAKIDIGSQIVITTPHGKKMSEINSELFFSQSTPRIDLNQ